MKTHQITMRNPFSPFGLRTSLFTFSLLGLLAASACGNSESEGAADPGAGEGDGDGTAGDGDGDGDGDVTGTGGGAPTGCDALHPAPSEVPAESSVTVAGDVSPFIVVDQFGYLPDSEKIAVFRSPQTGFDTGESFTPGATIELMDAQSDTSVLSGTATSFGGGTEHEQSGDITWHFDFSSITAPGVYYVRDTDSGARSAVFRVASDVYREVLKQALRSFYYQRAGFEKTAEFAGENWADGASHVGAGQDENARLFSATDDASTERDLSGGWYDAGDYNKYTPWHADYVAEMSRAYLERPEVFYDDYGIPESGNCIPDIVDEIRFGADYLLKLQEDDGSLLSIVDLSHASPPSSATEPSRYGPASTNATIRGATGLAYAALALEAFDSDYAATLTTAAEAAWTWALANPGVEFANNDGSNDLGAGQQQASAENVQTAHFPAALTLYRATGNAEYKTWLDANFAQPAYDVFEFGGGWMSGYELEFTSAYLEYLGLPDADPTNATAFLEPFQNAMAGGSNMGLLGANPDPYFAHADDINWGSNSHKSRIGLLLYSFAQHDIDAARAADSERAGAWYIHYIHGVNPLGLVYLSNMSAYGAENSVTQFYHTWFHDGSDWDEVGISPYGPAPGFLVGGPNASYNWDAQCPGQAGCGDAPPSPPFGQPALKSYAQFNDTWPLNSWEVTENSNGYQLAYIRLLSKYAN